MCPRNPPFSFCQRAQHTRQPTRTRHHLSPVRRSPTKSFLCRVTTHGIPVSAAVLPRGQGGRPRSPSLHTHAHTHTPTSEVGTPGAVTGGGQDAITAPSGTPLPTGQLRRLEMTCAAPAAGPAVFPVSAVRLPPQQHQHLLHHNSCSISPPRTTAALTLPRPQRAQLKSRDCPCVTRSCAPLLRRERLGTLRTVKFHSSLYGEKEKNNNKTR